MCGGRRGGLVWSVCEVGGSHVLVSELWEIRDYWIGFTEY
jgi:hypothetical protein